MLSNINLNKVLFLDIETVPLFATYKEVTKPMQQLWNEKATLLSLNANSTKNRDEITEEEKKKAGIDMYSRAGIFAEFGKIICISVGYFVGNNPRQFRIKSFFGDDEKQLLSDFNQLLNTHYNNEQYLLCAHNGKEFDFPYMARRMLVNRLPLPSLLDIAGKKPWEVNHLDTLELWKFGDYKYYTSLNLLATLFDIPTPKDDIKGSDVARVYWKDKNLDRIVAYCQKDVLTVAQLFLCYKGESLIDAEKVTIVS